MFGLQKNCKNKSTGFGVIGALVLFVLGYLFTQLRNKTTFDIKGLNEDRELTREEEILNEKRKAKRGQLASIIIAVTFGIFNACVDNFGSVDAATSTALIGMTLGGSLGFLADNILGSEEGYTTFENKGWGSAVEYAFGKLASGNFSRYGITVLMDMFVSLILFEPTFG